MADFRKYAVTVAGLACMLGAAGAASAQSFSGFTCNATATPFDMRAEGITEQAGDIVLTCTGGTVTPTGAQIPQVNITVSLNTNITSRLFSSSSGVSEALLLINEPASGTQSFCPGATTSGQNLCLEYGLGTGGGSTTQTYNPLFTLPVGVTSTARYNGVQGTYLGPTVGATNQLTFFGVPIDPPGPTVNVTNAAGQISSFTPTLTLRITNIRANASQLGAPSGFSSSAVFETVSTSAGFPINNNVQTVGAVRRGLIVTGVNNASQLSNTSSISLGAFGTFRTFQQCVSNALTTSSSSPALFGEQINFSEGFATATKLRAPSTGGTASISTGVNAQLATPGSILNTESQFVPFGPQGFDPNPAGTAGIGTANFATRIRIAFNAVQTGVTIYVPTTLTSNQGTELLTLTSSETGSFSAVSSSSSTGVPLTPSGQGFAALTVTANAAVAVYEVTSQSALAPSTIDTFSVPVLTTFTANPSANTPGLGASTVTVDFAPLSTNVVASTNAATATIPRFVQTNTAQTGFTISPCSTVLLFPFLTNLAGFDTGLAIAATATDPFGTLAQSGVCRLNFYGTAAPAQITTPSVTSGTVYTNLLSTLAPGFQGYMIAQCAFQYGHGFAFITDGFGGPGRGLSQGYLALIIPDPAANAGSRSPSNADYPPLNSGEGLTN